MSVWVLGIVMLRRNPFEIGTEILMHTFQQIARQTAQINLITKFRGDDQLPQPLIAGSLPVFKAQCNVDSLLIVTEPYALYWVMVCGALARQVSPVIPVARLYRGHSPYAISCESFNSLLRPRNVVRAKGWYSILLRQGDSMVFKKYSQMKLQMKRVALQKMNRQAK